MLDAQQDADLRGSCPNVFKKMEQNNNLRNTTNWNGPYKFNLPMDGSTTSSNGNNSEKLQPPPNFMKHQSPKSGNFYGTAVTTSILVN